MWPTSWSDYSPTQGLYVVPTPILATRTREALADRPRSLTYDRIAQDIDVSKRWLEQFAAGVVANPSVNTVERLYTYLTGKPLDV